MSEPERLSRSKGLAGALLLSAKTDKAPAGASRRLLAGAALGAALAAKSGAAGSLSASLGGFGSALGHVGRWTAWKWVVIGLAGAGSVATVKVALTARENARAHASAVANVARPAPARPTSARSLPPAAAPALTAIPAPATAAPVPPVAMPPVMAANAVAAPPVPAAPLPAHARASVPQVAALPAPPPPPQAASAAPTSHLALEIAAIDVAKRTLAAGDAASVLAKMTAYDAEFPHGMLAAEADAIRIEALVRVGRRDEARTELARFRASHPGSPLLESLTRVVGE